MPSFQNKNTILSNSLFAGQNRDSKVENGLVDPKRKADGEMNWERSTNIYTLPGENRQLTESCCIAQGAPLGAP